MNLAHWLYDKKRSYADGVAIFIHLQVDSDKNKYLNVPKPDKSRVDLLWRLLTNYARIHNIKPAKPIQARVSVPASPQHHQAAPQQGGIYSAKPQVVKHPHVNYDELPDELKQRWDEAAGLNRELKSCHNKLKLISKMPDQQGERAQLCSMIVDYETEIRTHYAVIDEWYASGKKNLVTQPEPHMSDLEKDKRIKANLNYLRRYLNDADKQDEVKKRRQELDNWGVNYERLIAKITG